ncbi:thiamine-phosphate kinase [Hwanghaeella grinnelliae]|uniref:Thiamine-monophosphate kinase n=1 Tax=Hwanghaeella grinnelliae TaxID=2500179 RepID=A0A3S2Y5S5_9PROT|nr:thiamine-phosphate kinase [Hwanghaeella grinnelliae]RVU39211.1 thiamine-phosphate kinase [Hwanghaeella grinnelliae]
MTMTVSGEFERIARFFAPLAKGFDGADGLNDDAAALPVPNDQDLIVSTDTIVEKIHYLGPEKPASIASKLLRVTLSDLASKGAVPVWYTMNLALPAKIDDAWLEGFCDGLARDQERYGVTLAGGDTVKTEGPVVLTLTGYGLAPAGKILRRGGARPGDLIYVTGTIGDGALGLECARGAFPELNWNARYYLVQRYELPDPPVALGAALIGIAHAAMDISDGLVADLAHMADASDLRAMIHAISVPVSDAAAEILSDCPDRLPSVLSGGDDYQILAAVPVAAEDAFLSAARKHSVAATRIGEFKKGSGVSVLDADGAELALAQTGYSHS